VVYWSVVQSACSVLIAAPDLIHTLKARASDGGGDVLTFSDADALKALEVITKRKPHIVSLEKTFAATPRGAALINRIKADPSLAECEIRVLSPDGDVSKVAPRKPAEGGGSGSDEGRPAASAATSAAAAVAAVPVVAPLDQRGTRRAPRFKVNGQVDVLVDGNVATLIDLSTIGAQVVSTTTLKPNQRVRMALNDDLGSVRFNASVAWASFEIPPKSGPRYRAGLEFVDADSTSVDAYCARHKQ